MAAQVARRVHTTEGLINPDMIDLLNSSHTGENYQLHRFIIETLEAAAANMIMEGGQNSNAKILSFRRAAMMLRANPNPPIKKLESLEGLPWITQEIIDFFRECKSLEDCQGVSDEQRKFLKAIKREHGDSLPILPLLASALAEQNIPKIAPSISPRMGAPISARTPTRPASQPATPSSLPPYILSPPKPGTPVAGAPILGFTRGRSATTVSLPGSQALAQAPLPALSAVVVPSEPSTPVLPPPLPVPTVSPRSGAMIAAPLVSSPRSEKFSTPRSSPSTPRSEKFSTPRSRPSTPRSEEFRTPAEIESVEPLPPLDRRVKSPKLSIDFSQRSSPRALESVQAEAEALAGVSDGLSPKSPRRTPSRRLSSVSERMVARAEEKVEEAEEVLSEAEEMLSTARRRSTTSKSPEQRAEAKMEVERAEERVEKAKDKLFIAEANAGEAEEISRIAKTPRRRQAKTPPVEEPGILRALGTARRESTEAEEIIRSLEERGTQSPRKRALSSTDGKERPEDDRRMAMDRKAKEVISKHLKDKKIAARVAGHARILSDRADLLMVVVKRWDNVERAAEALKSIKGYKFIEKSSNNTHREVVLRGEHTEHEFHVLILNMADFIPTFIKYMGSDALNNEVNKAIKTSDFTVTDTNALERDGTPMPFSSISGLAAALGIEHVRFTFGTNVIQLEPNGVEETGF